MKSKREWFDYFRTQFDIPGGEYMRASLQAMFAAVQADAAADMRERAAKRLSKAAKFEEENGNQFPDQLEVHMHAVAVLKTVAVDVRALPLEES